MDQDGSTVSLRQSAGRVGKLYPILVDSRGEIIDGTHRFAADPNWPQITLQNIKTEKQKLLIKLIGNVCRRHVPEEEKTQILKRLGEIYLSEGIKEGTLAHIISGDTGMSYRWVMKYLPNRLKKRPGLGGPHKGCSNGENLNPSAMKSTRIVKLRDQLMSYCSYRVVTITSYAHTQYAGVMLDRTVYSRFEKAAQKLGIKVDTIISYALISALKEIERI